VLLTGDEGIKCENKRLRGIDSPTDVLSFPMIDFSGREGAAVDAAGAADGWLVDVNPDSGRVMLGDIIISLERAEAQAGEYGHSLNRELSFLTVHGVLHLCGYDHVGADGEKEMFELQDLILKELGY